MNRLLLLGLLALAPHPAFAKSRPAQPVIPPPPVLVVAPPPDPLATMPTVPPSAAFVPPTPAVSALSNRVPVWILPSPALPIFTLVLTVPGGSQLDAFGKEGTAALAMESMRRGAGSRAGQAFAAEVERRGLSIGGGAGSDGSYLTLTGPVSQLEPGLDLLADLVLRAKLEPKEIKKARELLLAGLQQNLDEPGFVAYRTAQALYWGPKHPYGRPDDGTVGGLKAAGPSDVKRWYKAAWSSTGATITVAGAVDEATLTPKLEARFGGWPAGKPVVGVAAAAPAHTAEPLYLVDAPGSAQTGFFVAFPGLPQADPAEAPTRLGTVALGGTFTSRMNALLREKRGYTYGVHAGMDQRRAGGTLLVRTRIRTDVTAEALVDLLGELDGIRKGITSEELGKALGAARQDAVESLESQSGVAATYAEELAAGHAPGSVAGNLAALGAVGLDAVTAPMAAWNQDRAVFVLVGDRKLIEPKLREKGFTNLQIVTPP